MRSGKDTFSFVWWLYKKVDAMIDTGRLSLRGCNTQEERMKELVVIAVMAMAVTAYTSKRGYRAPSALGDFPPYQGSHQYQPIHKQYHPFWEEPHKTQQPYRHRHYRQNIHFHADQQFLKDYSSLNNRLFHDDAASFKDSPPFKGQSSFFANEMLFGRQPEENHDTFGNELISQDQMLNHNYQELFRDDFRFIDLYNKLLENHVFGSELLVLPYQNVQPSNEGTSRTIAPPKPATTNKPSPHSAISSMDSAITQVHTSATSEPKMASTKASLMATMPTAKSDTLADVATTTVSTPTVSTAAANSGAAMQSSNSADSSAALTTEASLSVADTKSPITFVGRHGIIFNQSLSDASKNNASSKIQGSALNFASPKESKSALKKKPQSCSFNYLLQQESRQGRSFLQPTKSETLDYIPVSAATGRPKSAASCAPIATLSAVSRPLQTINYVPTTLSRALAFATQDLPASSGHPLGASLSSPGLSSSVAASQAASVFNSLPGGISGGISAGIPGNMSPGVPASIPTLNFGQNFRHVGQLRQLEPAKSEPYFTGWNWSPFLMGVEDDRDRFQELRAHQ